MGGGGILVKMGKIHSCRPTYLAADSQGPWGQAAVVRSQRGCTLPVGIMRRALLKCLPFGALHRTEGPVHAPNWLQAVSYLLRTTDDLLCDSVDQFHVVSTYKEGARTVALHKPRGT